jgi:hypothetical protein
MIKNFFQSLEKHGVDYLLISGQATVLYGAAAFSEDIDLWIDPTHENVACFARVLQNLNATYYKLSPVLSVDYLRRGHGLHFILPDQPEVYLDIMGRPPRVSAYKESVKSRVVIDTAWGKISTVGVRDLICLKMTQRLGDYPIIGRLVINDIAANPSPSEVDCRWAIDHIYTLEDFDELIKSQPAVKQYLPAGTPAHAYAIQDHPASEVCDALEGELLNKMQLARQQDRLYWRPIIEELKDLRSTGQLAVPGQLVEPEAR